MAGVCATGPAAPKPITGVPSDASVMTGNPAGNEVPTVPAATAFEAPATASMPTIPTIARWMRMMLASSVLRDDSGLGPALSHGHQTMSRPLYIDLAPP